jgi:hypothetical protein
VDEGGAFGHSAVPAGRAGFGVKGRPWQDQIAERHARGVGFAAVGVFEAVNDGVARMGFDVAIADIHGQIDGQSQPRFERFDS